MDAKEQKLELRVLWVSTALTALCAAGNIAVSVICDSMTLLLNGLYGMVDVAISLLMLIVVNKLHEPPNSRYHFGYAKYEPLMVFVEGIMFATVCVFAIVMGVQDVVNPEPVEHIRAAVTFSLLAGSVCAGYGLYMKNVARRCASPLIGANAELSIAEGLISLGVFAAFGFAHMMPRSSWMSDTSVIDPVMCITIALVLLKKPAAIIRESFRDLLDASIDEDKQDELKHMLKRIGEKYRLAHSGDLKVRKAGRRMFLTVSFLAERDRTLQELEKMREGISAELHELHPGADICVLFRSHK
ncbi:MAG TPA: cation diffusion facilitator family transporter [bacterium]|nr:cation diffusion facilitator family transporter [bacterium]